MGKNTLRFSESKAIPNNDNTFTVSKDVAKALGLEENSKLRVTIKNDRVEILPNIHSLGKLYIEPTSLCNLACSTCIRHAWNEKMGNMSLDLFDHLTNQLSDFKNLRSVMFGGFGEPLFHKDIQYMIQKMNELGLTTEVTTNGTLLDEDMLQGLFSSGLNTLWVSLDGAHLDSYHQASGSYRDVLESLCRLATLNEQTTHPIEIGIAVVVTKGNIQSLPGIINLAERLRAKKVSVSNVLPYTTDAEEEILYKNVLSHFPSNMEISLPLLDLDDNTSAVLVKVLRSPHNISIMSNRIGTEQNSCRFIRERCTFVRWDGIVSPCMGLLHSHTSYLPGNFYSPRKVTRYAVGNLNEQSLQSIWNSEEYHQFREKVDTFDFSPCSACGGCENAEANQEDCHGNQFPTCGGCLWAQGVIQCP